MGYCLGRRLELLRIGVGFYSQGWSRQFKLITTAKGAFGHESRRLQSQLESVVTVGVQRRCMLESRTRVRIRVQVQGQGIESWVTVGCQSQGLKLGVRVGDYRRGSICALESEARIRGQSCELDLRVRVGCLNKGIQLWFRVTTGRRLNLAFLTLPVLVKPFLKLVNFRTLTLI